MLSGSVLASMRGCGATLATSLYGQNETLHDAVTLVPGSFNRTLKSIGKALAIGVPVRIGINANTLSDEDLEATVALARNFGVERISVHGTQPVGRAAANFEVAKAVGCGRCGNRTLCITANGTVLPCVFARSQQLGTIWDWDWQVNGATCASE